MKKYFFVIATFIILGSCNNEGDKTATNKASVTSATAAKDTGGYTTIQWVDSLKNIGTIAAGKKTEISFAFKNTGEKPLFIISAEPGCGCTVADFPKEAIAPGSEGVITAAYDAPSEPGEFRKNIHVTTNTKGSDSHYIFFYGVIKKEGDSAASRDK